MAGLSHACKDIQQGYLSKDSKNRASIWEEDHYALEAKGVYLGWNTCQIFNLFIEHIQRSYPEMLEHNERTSLFRKCQKNLCTAKHALAFCWQRNVSLLFLKISPQKFRRVRKEDAGEYYCQAKNDAGHAQCPPQKMEVCEYWNVWVSLFLGEKCLFYVCQWF